MRSEDDRRTEATPTIVNEAPQDVDVDAFESFKDAPCLKEGFKAFKSTIPHLYTSIFEGKRPNIEMAAADDPLKMIADAGFEESVGRIQSFMQSCKAYLPSVGNMQALAAALSRLDPHGIAPLVVTSVFFVIQASSRRMFFCS